MRIILHGTGPPYLHLGVPATEHQRAAVAEGFCPDCRLPLSGDTGRFCAACRTAWQGTNGQVPTEDAAR